jgi:hypothetical protein
MPDFTVLDVSLRVLLWNGLQMLKMVLILNFTNDLFSKAAAQFDYALSIGKIDLLRQCVTISCRHGREKRLTG